LIVAGARSMLNPSTALRMRSLSSLTLIAPANRFRFSLGGKPRRFQTGEARRVTIGGEGEELRYDLKEYVKRLRDAGKEVSPFNLKERQ